MDTDTAANPADDGVVTLADPIEEASSQASSEEAQAPAGESQDTLDDLTKEALGNPEATPEEEIEVEYEGDTRKLPPKWRDAFLRHQDYTRKTMDLGEQRESLKSERESFQQTASQIAANFQAHVELGTLQAQIKQLEQTDISYWTDQEVANGQAQLAQLKAKAASLAQDLTSHHQNTQRMESENIARLREACLREAAARVPNFTDQRRTELEKLAVESGADPKEVANLTDTWAYELLHFADIGKKFIARQRAAAQMRTAHAGTPATMLGSASSGGKDPNEMSEAEYFAWREAGNG